MRATDRQAPLIVLAAAALFGLSTPLAKLLLGDVSPWLLNAGFDPMGKWPVSQMAAVAIPGNLFTCILRRSLKRFSF